MDRKFDRRLNVMLAISTLIAIALVVGGLLAIPAIFAGRDNSDRVAQSEAISSCRAVYSSTVSDLNSQLTVLNIQGQIANALHDTPQLTKLIDTAEQKVKAEKIAARIFLRQVRLSKEHPEQFLKECQG